MFHFMRRGCWAKNYGRQADIRDGKKSVRNKLQRFIAAFCVAVAAAACVLAATPTMASAKVSTQELSVEERDDLCSHSVLGTVGGALTETLLLKAYPEADLQLFSTEADVVAALSGGKLQYAFISEFFAYRFMEGNDGYKFIMPYFVTYDDSFGVAKGNDSLRTSINEILTRMREDGTLDSIKQKWEFDRNYTMDDVPVLDTDNVLRVATTGADEPYTFIVDGEHAGEAIEIIERIAYELGYRCEFQDMSFSSEVAAVASGKADVATQLMKTEEREKQIDFTDVYISLNYGALIKTDEQGSVDLWESIKDNFTGTFITENRWQLVARGLGTTCLIACGSFVVGTLGGALLAAMRRSKRAVLQTVARGYIKLTTGVPALVWLMVLYYIVFAKVDIPAVAVSIICFGLLSAAALAEVYVAGLESVSSGQTEAALAMGFSHAHAFRRIVLPQAARAVWPLYTGQLTTLIKETSVVGYVAIMDLTKASDIIRSRTFQAFFPLFATAAVYFVAIALSAWILGRVGRRLDPKRRKPEAILKGVKA